MANFIKEMKRRKLFRAAIFYGAAAWLLMQIAEILLQALRLPDSALTFVLIAVVVGFPIAMVVSWYFDITPGGFQRDESPERDNAPTTPEYRGDTRVKTLAVLPFSNLSGDTSHEYFSDGLVENIITELSLIPALVVIARNSTFVYKEKTASIRQIGDELNVSYVLQGSIRIADKRLRATVQLVDVATEKNIWSKRYDRDLDDIFALQDDLTNEIVAILDIELASGEEGRHARSKYSGPEAGEALYRGMFQFFLYEKNANAAARRYFEELVELEPDSVLGYGWLVAAWAFALIVGFENPQIALKALQENVDLAMAIDENDLKTLCGSAMYHAVIREHEKALKLAEKAVAVAPSNNDAYQTLGWIRMLIGDTDLAIENLRYAGRLCPVMQAVQRGLLATAYRNAGLFDESIREFSDCLHEFPGFLSGYAGLATAYGAKGDNEAACEEIRKLLSRDPQYTVQRFITPNLYQDQTAMVQWADLLREAGLPEGKPDSS